MRRAIEPGGASVAPEAPAARISPAAGRRLVIVLAPLSHSELGPIRIDETLFAVGRTEAPFDAYPPEIVADLSRRHARIFCEGGAVYLADLDSKNGTTVNGNAVQHAITRLSNGDAIGFGRTLCYRVQLVPGDMPERAAKLASLTLTPERSVPGLQPIVVTRFPFLIGKADDAFARYRDAYADQVNYLSRRHAHIFLKGGLPYVEDLGSTNGTFVGARRLDEHAVALKEGDVVAFGGHHFVYRLSMQWDQAALDPTVTRLGPGAPGAAPAPADADKTTFVAAADSFLDIFCVEAPLAHKEEPDEAAAPQQPADAARARGKVGAFLAELGAGGGGGMHRALRWSAVTLAIAGVLGWALYRSGAPEREVRDLLASGAYARAAAAASAGLADDPDNTALKAMGTQAVLKAKVPAWAALLKAHQFDAAAAQVGAMRQLGQHNPELRPLVAELEWIGQLENFVSARGGAQAPRAGPADAARIKLILKQWEDDSEAHQRAFAIISSSVPAYRDTYAEALSHVRKLALSQGRDEHEPATQP